MPSSTGLGNATSGQNNNSKRVPNVMSNPKELVFTDGVPASYDFSIHFRDADTYELLTIPTGMTFDVDTGILSGTPTGVSGARPFIKGTNANGDSINVIVDWLVAA